MKKLIITKEGSQVSISTEMEGQELYEAYVALTGYIATNLIDPNSIENLAQSAVKDAKKILTEKNKRS